MNERKFEVEYTTKYNVLLLQEINEIFREGGGGSRAMLKNLACSSPKMNFTI